jgi:hypothetical protein
MENSINNMLLFALKSGFNKVRLEPNKLPIFVASDDTFKYLQGTKPVSLEFINKIKKEKNIKKGFFNIKNDYFLMSLIDDTVTFKHIPEVNTNFDEEIISSLFAKNGIINIVGKSTETNKLIYSMGTYLAKTLKKEITILENQKDFHINSNKVFNLFDPKLDLATLIRLSFEVPNNFILIPSYFESIPTNEINFLSTKKIIILGSIKKENLENVIYFKDLEKKEVVKKINTKVNFDKIIESFKEGKNAKLLL